MREHFDDSTIFCIAHKLVSIFYFDEVPVMDDGQVAETGSPQVLLRIIACFRG